MLSSSPIKDRLSVINIEIQPVVSSYARLL